jgi:hypothetical protein
VGDDSLDGGVSDVYNPDIIDTLNGDAGNDSFLARGFYGAGNYNGGAGIDTLDFSQSDAYTAGRRNSEGAGVSVDLTASKASTYYRIADNVTWTDANGQLTVASIENVKGTAQSDLLYGDGNANFLEGLAGKDVIYGALGTDTLKGGAGDDTYYLGYLENIADVIIENSDEGSNDRVLSFLSNYTLADNVETLWLQAGAINGTGNAENNTLIGNSSDNRLDGGLGTDTLVGGLGNDAYYVDDTGDVVAENAGGGWDMVYSSITSYVLSANIEGLTLLGTTLNALGNADSNALIGNALDNFLDGGAGSDFINGGAGDDTLDGGVSDAYNPGLIEILNGEAGNDSFLARGFFGAGYYNGGADIDTLDFSQSDAYTAGRRNSEGAGVSVDLTAGKASTYYRVADNVTWIDANGQIAVTGIENVKGTAQGDKLIGDINANVFEAGNGSDILAGGVGKDLYLLQESVAATDTLKIATGDSLKDSYDIAEMFKLGTGTINTIGVDKLDLSFTSIAVNVNNDNGTDFGNIGSHSISNGLMSFATVTGNTPLEITATNFTDAINYVQAAITGKNTVVFVADGNTFVFQDGGVTDTLVELVGIMANSVNNSGLGVGAVWIV